MLRVSIIRPAILIAAGNVLSRTLGLGREALLANLFGATGLVSSYRIAAVVPTMFHDLLVGGMVNSALVPTFSEYAERNQSDLGRVVGLVIGLALLTLSGVILLAELCASQIAWLLGGGLPSPLLVETTHLIRLTVPALLFLGLSSILSGLLYGLRHFALPAFTTAIFNATIIAVTLLTAKRWGIRSMALGLLLGAVLQVVLQLPSLRRIGFIFKVDLRDPELRRILRLSLPVFVGLVINQLAVGIDRNLASHIGEQTIAWMQYATTLIQFPLGLVAAAISLALLPSLSRHAVNPKKAELCEESQEMTTFRSTLAQGLRLVLLLIIPATAGLIILADFLVRLLFQHGDFTAFDTIRTAHALRVYALGLTFAAVDQLLIVAFYALKDTLTPAIVGVLGVGIYLGVALPLLDSLGMTGLVLANSLQWAGHTVVMLWLIRRRLGGMGSRSVWTAGVHALLATILMSVLVMGVQRHMITLVDRTTLVGQLLSVAVSAGLGGTLYAAVLMALGVEECQVAWHWLTRAVTGAK